MKKLFNTYPLYGGSFFLLSLVIKLYLMAFLIVQRTPGISFYFSIPFFFVEDGLVAVVIFLLLDYALENFKEKLWGFSWWFLSVFINLLFFIIILYTMINIKFYQMFGTFLTYGLLLQAHAIGSFAKGIYHEVDYTVYVYVFLALAFSVLIMGMNWQKDKGNRRILLNDEAARHKFFMIFLMGYTALFWFLPRNPFAANLFYLEKNPLYEMAATTITDVLRYQNSSREAGLPESNSATPNPGGSSEHPSSEGSHSAENERGSGYPELTEQTNQTHSGIAEQAFYSSESIVSPGKWLAGVPVNPEFENIRDNLNIIYFKLESTVPFYTGVDNPAYQRYTPNISRLARDSLYLENHYSVEPASLKTSYAVLTGKYSYKTTDWHDFYRKSGNDASIAGILKKQGYATWFLSSADGNIYLQNKFMERWFDKVFDKQSLLKAKHNYRDFGMGVDDRALVDAFDELLDQRKEKFFAFFSPIFPHHPYFVPGKEFAINNRKNDFEKYLDSLYYADFIIGEIERLLIKHGIEENTLLIVFSDHGEAFRQHPYNQLHSLYLYEENVHTLCLFHGPRLFSGIRYNAVTSHVDITPSVLDLLGLPAGGMDGVSLFSDHTARLAPFFTSFSKNLLGARDENWKYVLNGTYHTEELYDLGPDPEEKVNLFRQYPDLCAKFRNNLLLFEEYVE